MQRPLCTGHPSFIPRYDVQCPGDVRSRASLPTNSAPPRAQKAWAGVTQARGYYTGPEFHPCQGVGPHLAGTGHRGGIVTGEMGTHMSGTL